MGEDKKGEGNKFVDFLEGVFEECNKARIEKNAATWYDLLVVATLNLSTEMSGEELVYFNDLRKRLYPLVLDAQGLSSIEVVVIPFDVENELFDWEVKLRKIRRDNNLQHKVLKEKRRLT